MKNLPKKHKTILNINSNEKGIAILLALGFLSLIAILALTYATTTSINQKAAKSNNDLASARMLAKSVVNRTRLGMKTYSGILSNLKSEYRGEHNAENTSVDIVKNEDLKNLLPSTVNDIIYYTEDDYNCTTPHNQPTWEYITIEEDGVSKLFGRMAFAVSNHNGSLSLEAAVDNLHSSNAVSEYNSSLTTPPDNTGTDSSTGDVIVGRPGVNVNEIWLGSLNDKALPDDEKLFKDTILKEISSDKAAEGKMPEDGWGNKFIFFGAEGLDVKDIAKKNEMLNYFSFGNPPDKEAFWNADSDDDGLADDGELYHRFNLIQTNIDSDSITASSVEYAPETSGGGIPWLANWNTAGEMGNVTTAKNQIIANLVDYNDIDDDASTDSRDNPTYVGLEKVPYINELKVELESNLNVSTDGFAIWAAGAISVQPLWGGKTTISSAHANGPIAAQGDVVFTGTMEQNTYASVPAFPNATIDPWTTDLSYYNNNKANVILNQDIELKHCSAHSGYIDIYSLNGGYLNHVPDKSIIYVENHSITIAESGFDRSVTLIAKGSVINIKGDNVTINPADGTALMYSGAEIHITGDNFTGSGNIRSKGSMAIQSRSATITNASIVALGSMAVQCAGDTNITAGGYAYIIIKQLDLELVNMYDEARTCEAEVTIDYSYDWVIDDVYQYPKRNKDIESEDYEPDISDTKVYNLTFSTNSENLASGNGYTIASFTSKGTTDKEADIFTTEVHPNAGGALQNIKNFEFTDIKVKLVSGDNLYDFSKMSFLSPDKPENTLIGKLNINPANANSDHEFQLFIDGDDDITMTTMKDYYLDDANQIKDNDDNLKNTNLIYSGSASKIKIMAKVPELGGTSITLNGITGDLDTSEYYTIEGDLTVYLYNKLSQDELNINGWEQGKGHWWINIAGKNVTMSPDPGFDDKPNHVIFVDGTQSSYYIDFEIGDPRQNLNTEDWIMGITHSDKNEKIGSIDSVNAMFANRPRTGDGVDDEPNPDKDTELEPWNISTAYIRNAPMHSPWELGAIHRGTAWQTLNLKKYNTNEGKSGGGNSYTDGDANILDQIKMTSATTTLGKINVNATEKKVLRTLFHGISVNSGYNAPGTKADMIDITAADTLDDAIIIASKSTATADQYTKKFNTRAEIVNETDKFADNSLNLSQMTDAAQEEIIGKFINLTKASNIKSNQLTIIAIAQTIDDVGGGVTINKDLNYNGSIEEGETISETEFGKYDQYADQITATQKLLIIMYKTEDGKYRIRHLEYLND